MSDLPPPAAAATPSALPALDPVTVFFMLGSDIRWPALRLLAAGPPRRAADIARALKRETDTVNRQLKLLVETGFLVMEDGPDRRFTYFSLTPGLLNSSGQLDLGYATISLLPR